MIHAGCAPKDRRRCSACVYSSYQASGCIVRSKSRGACGLPESQQKDSQLHYKLHDYTSYNNEKHGLGACQPHCCPWPLRTQITRNFNPPPQQLPVPHRPCHARMQFFTPAPSGTTSPQPQPSNISCVKWLVLILQCLDRANTGSLNTEHDSSGGNARHARGKGGGGGHETTEVRFRRRYQCKKRYT